MNPTIQGMAIPTAPGMPPALSHNPDYNGVKEKFHPPECAKEEFRSNDCVKEEFNRDDSAKEEFRPNACPICKRCLTCPEGSLGVECKCLPQEVRWNRARLQNGYLDFRHKVIVANKPTGAMLIQWLKTKAGTRYNWGEDITEVNICVRCNSHWMRFKKVANAHTVAECVTRLQAKYCGKCLAHPAGCYINGKRHVPLDSKLYHQWAQFVVNNQYSATEDFLPELFEVESSEATVPDMASPPHSLPESLKRTDHPNITPIQILPKKTKTEPTKFANGSQPNTHRDASTFSNEYFPSTESHQLSCSYTGVAPHTPHPTPESSTPFTPKLTTVSVRSTRKLYKSRVAVTDTTTFEAVLRFAIPISPPPGLRIRVWNGEGGVEYMPTSLVTEAIKGVEHADIMVTLEPMEPVDFSDF